MDTKCVIRGIAELGKPPHVSPVIVANCAKGAEERVEITRMIAGRRTGETPHAVTNLTDVPVDFFRPFGVTVLEDVAFIKHHHVPVFQQ
jgi:hypothetical protein